MENLLKKFGIEGLLAILAFAFACVGMWGCTDVDFHWSDNRSKAKIIGFVDDSLVMVGDYRYWSEITDEWNGGYSEIEGFGHERLCVYNYRVQEDGPRWCDSLENETETGAFMGQMTDSVIWGSGLPNLLKLWKIGENQHEIKLVKRLDGCLGEFRITSVKQWIGGNFIVQGEGTLIAKGDSCQYAVLDTIQKIITYKRLDVDLEWIKQCDDVRAWGNEVYCVFLDNEGEKSLVLKNKQDTISAPRKFAIGGFWGDMIKLNGNICSIKDDSITCSDVTWRGNELKFYRNDEVLVEY